MFTLNNIYSDTLEVKGSKFLPFLFPISLFSEQLATLRSLHPKAVHYVSATRKLNEFDQIVESSSDDGEPKGTSGKPTLTVLQGHNLINIGIITVRYFGGTKLGPGGLVRAYADAANLAVLQAVLVPYEKLFVYRFTCTYKNVSLVEYELAQKEVRLLSKDFDEKGALFTIEETSQKWEILSQILGRTIEINHK